MDQAGQFAASDPTKLIVSCFFVDVDKAAGLVTGKFINGFGEFSTRRAPTGRKEAGLVGFSTRTGIRIFFQAINVLSRHTPAFVNEELRCR